MGILNAVFPPQDCTVYETENKILHVVSRHYSLSVVYVLHKLIP